MRLAVDINAIHNTCTLLMHREVLGVRKVTKSERLPLEKVAPPSFFLPTTGVYATWPMGRPRYL